MGMKRMILVLTIAAIAASAVLAQETIYASARGSKSNLGWSETEPTDFSSAITQAILGVTKKIVITGTLDINSNGIKNDGEEVFNINDFLSGSGIRDTAEVIIITGKPGASGAERAVLSARGSGNTAVTVSNIKIRFEHIEISGSEGKYGYGLYITNNAQVTLGPGAVVRNNAHAGIFVVNDGICIIEGGDVHNNNNSGVGIIGGVLTLRSGSIRDNNSSGTGGGVLIGDDSRFTMSGGTITGNRTATSDYYIGGGVYIAKGGRFTMSGGIITNNRSQGAGGGVYVDSGARFDQTGGTVSGNKGQGSDIYREIGSLGSSSTGGSSSGSASSGSSSSGSSSSDSSSSGFNWNIPIFLGFYLQGYNKNTATIGLPFQLGVEFDFGKVMSLAMLGEASGGVGYPYMVEGNLGGMAEVYFLNRSLGLGVGGGSSTVFLPWVILFTDDHSYDESNVLFQSNYIRFALILGNNLLGKSRKLSLFAQCYTSGDWGFGLQFVSNILGKR
jgi:hypothetical protein